MFFKPKIYVYIQRKSIKHIGLYIRQYLSISKPQLDVLNMRFCKCQEKNKARKEAVVYSNLVLTLF